MPSKTLLRSPELVAAAKIAPGARLGPLDVAAVFEWRDKVVDGWNDAGQEQWLAERRIELVRGEARRAAPGRLEVGGDELLLAKPPGPTGAPPASPPIPGLPEV